MIIRQEIFGAGDLKANEELKETDSKKKDVLTKEWLLEKSEEIVRSGINTNILQNWPADNPPYKPVFGVAQMIQSAKVFITGQCFKTGNYLFANLVVSTVQTNPAEDALQATELHYVVLKFSIENGNLGVLTEGIVDEFY